MGHKQAPTLFESRKKFGKLKYLFPLSDDADSAKKPLNTNI